MRFPWVDMAKRVTVYRFAVYDIRSDETVKSRRLATPEAIERARGTVLEETPTEIDAAGLQPDRMTDRNFDPRWRPVFQTQVSP